MKFNKFKTLLIYQTCLMPFICFNAFALESDYDAEHNQDNKVILSLDQTENESLIDLILMGGDAVQGSTALVIDDGVAENFIGDAGQFIWLNRFTPAPSEFPFILEEVSAIFGDNGVTAGQDIEILVYADTDEDGDPTTGAVLLASYDETIQTADQVTFNVYSLKPFVQLYGPGDVLIGIVNRSGSEGNNDFPAAIDQSNSQVRSWAASYIAGDVPVNPPLPGDEQWGTIDSFGFAGNWIIRGAGTSGYTVGGTLTGLLPGNEVVIQNNGGDDLTLTNDGSYSFLTLLNDNDAYNVTVLTEPTSPIQNCTVSNESGTITGASVSNVDISCDNLDLIFRNSFE